VTPTRTPSRFRLAIGAVLRALWASLCWCGRTYAKVWREMRPKNRIWLAIGTGLASLFVSAMICGSCGGGARREPIIPTGVPTPILVAATEAPSRTPSPRAELRPTLQPSPSSEPTPAVTPPPTASPTPAPSPTASSVPIATAAPTLAPTHVPPTPDPCAYIGNSNTRKFHRASCAEIRKMKDEHKVCLATREDAIGQGYVPCAKCNP